MHDINMMMMRRDHLRHQLGGIYGVEDLQMRLEHLSSLHNQILRLFLHVVMYVQIGYYDLINNIWIILEICNIMILSS